MKATVMAVIDEDDLQKCEGANEEALRAMLLTTALSLFLGFWSSLFLADHYLRTRNFKTYLDFAERTGLLITPFQVRWYSSHFQSWMSFVSCLRVPRVQRFVSAWFTVGAASAIVSFVGMIIFLTHSLVTEIGRWWAAAVYDPDLQGITTSSPSSEDTGLLPVVPGVNVPWEHMPLFLLSLIIAGVFHELGHALAAINENVGVNGFGVFLLAIYPGAFTEIESESLGRATLLRKLRIYCGGVWHNIVLTLFALTIFYSLPIVLSPAYMTNKGVVVTSLSPDSGLAGPAGLSDGHVVYGINHCKVHNEDDWYNCLSEMRRSNFGNCVSKKDVAAQRAQKVANVYGELQCCDDNLNATQSHLCFYYKNETFVKAEFEYSCLPARYVTDHYVCNSSLPCRARTTCIYPALFNSTKLFRFFIANSSRHVLFIGHLSEVTHLVSVSGYVPRSSLFPTWLPVVLELFCKYLITFSLALALLNAVPCHSLDGQFILAVIVDGLCHRKWDRRKQLVYNLIMYYGTFLLVANVVVGLIKFMRPYVTS
uniref:Membrane-bound transcription factor site-2 protease n=1 Tax=Plectus sambesii TaxID=2011161 RepID=A0A914WUB6_9BILA